jgi:acyl-CoA synthetase (AMP-forming)/AMP-acid ligase II
MNLAKNLEVSALFFRDQPAVRQAGFEMTYAQLNEQASRIATGLLKMEVFE